MKVRLLLISMLLGCQLTAWGQETCAQKIKDCKAGCTSLSDIKKITACKNQCPLTACATPTPTPTGTPLVGALDVIPHRIHPVLVTLTGALPDRQWDDNTFLRNPNWRGGAGIAPCGFCPCQNSPNEAAAAWMNTSFCTSQTIHVNSDSKCGLPIDSLLQPTASGIPYHMNWFPVEYEGMLTWDSHSTWIVGPHDSGDNEYSFDIHREDHALETNGRDGVHLEFNSRQTVDHWDDAGDIWWKDFHHNVVDAGHDDKIAPFLASFADPGKPGPFAIVIGLLGLDIPHIDQHSELHPVYAMFIRLRLSPTKDKWAFFVRNWGVEGFCGPNDEPITDNKTIRVRIQHKGSAHANVNPKVSSFSDKDKDKCAQNEWSFEPVDDGVLLTFDLTDPSNKCGWVGDLDIDWKVPDDSGRQHPIAFGPGALTAHAAVPLDNESAPTVLSAGIAKLEPSERQQLSKQLADLASVPTAVRKGPSKPATHWHPPKPPKGLPNYGKKLKSVPDPDGQAREARERQFIDAFLKAHGIQ